MDPREYARRSPSGLDGSPLARTADAAPPELTTCPSCGTHVHPIEKVVGGIAYFNCRRCDFSTWNWPDWLALPENIPLASEVEHRDPEVIPATDEEIERSFDAYR